MPSVPTYDVPQVQPTPLQQPDLHSVASPEILGRKAQQDMDLAKGVMSAGTGLSQIAYHMQERETADVAFRAETKLKDDYIKQEQDWRQNRQGRFAKDLTKDAGDWFDKQIKDSSEMIGQNQKAQRLFQRRAMQLREQSVAGVSHWEAGQLEKSHDESWLADKNVTKSVAAASPTLGSVETARTEIRRLNAYQAGRKGWEGAQLEGENLKDLTDLHTQVIQQLAQTNPNNAATYFEKYKSEIDGTRQAEIGKFAKQATATSLGEAGAGAVWEKLGPKSDAAPVELDKMEAEVRKEFKDNEFAVKAGLASLKERAAAHNSSQAERQADNVNKVWKMANGGAGLGSVLRSAEYAQLPGEKQKEIRQAIEDRTHMLVTRNFADRERMEREKQLDYSAAYHTYSDPEVLSGMTRAQVQALEPTIGKQYADQLLSKWESIRTHQGGLSEARIDNDAFKTLVRDFGFDPDRKLNLKKDSDKTEAARMGAMRDEVERQIGLEQGAKKRVLTREEKDVIARKTLSQSVLRGGPWYQFGFGTEQVPAASVIPADLKSVKVPPGDREAISSELKKRNKPVTDEEIARWYLMGQRRQK
jgi:hypothetical protein